LKEDNSEDETSSNNQALKNLKMKINKLKKEFV
jgi:hypothetical protein